MCSRGSSRHCLVQADTIMLTDLQRDILIKSAEGIQEGMWCVGNWFSPVPHTSEKYASSYGAGLEILWDDQYSQREEIDLGALSKSYRCVEGELAFRTILLGGTYDDFHHLELVVGNAVDKVCGACRGVEDDTDLFNHNDFCMEGKDSFTAGQEWADIFRSVL